MRPITWHPETRSTHRSHWIDPEEAAEAMRKGNGRGIKVALLDSGIELSHPMLRGLRLADDIAFVKVNSMIAREAGRGIDVYGHGTGVAYMLHRIAPEAQIGSFRVLNQNLGSSSKKIQTAALEAIRRGYHILNCSFGCDAEKKDAIYYSIFKNWFDEAYRHGVHIVSACDNHDYRKPEWPGHFPTVITVNMARTQTDDLLFRWEHEQGRHSDHLVEFAAPGYDLRLPTKNGGDQSTKGSSFAAPHAAGLLARLLSVHPAIKPSVAKALLQEIALPWGPDNDIPR